MRSWKAKLLCTLLVSLFAQAPAAEACTAFSAPTAAGPLVAKGFDWSTGDGWLVLNERNRTRSLLFTGGSPADSWTSRFASLSLTTIGPGFPISGANEAGLAIEALVDLSGAATTVPSPGRLTGLELIQYGLDRFATVDELSDFVERAGYSQLAVSLHFLACDRSGACAVIEHGRQGARVTRGAALATKVLANRAFAEDLQSARPSRLSSWLGLGPKPGSSAARFGSVARGLGAARSIGTEEAFRLLEKVLIPGRTRWQIVWELQTGTVRLRRRDAFGGTAQVRLDPRSASCDGAPQVRRIGPHGLESAFTTWSAREVANAERAVLSQLPRSPAARRLAMEVARATGSSACAAAK